MKNTAANKTARAALTLLAAGACLFTQDAVARDMVEQPRIRLRTLEKTTARTMTFEANVGSTLKFGSLFIKVQSCQKSSPVEQPEAAAFLQIWENDPEKKGQEQESHWVFSGWMFSSSPALSPMDHAIYDVWVLDCIGTEGEQSVTTATGDAADVDSEITAEAPQPPDTKDFNSLLQGITGVNKGEEDAPAGDATQPDTSEDAPVTDEPQNEIEADPPSEDDETQGLPGAE